MVLDKLRADWRRGRARKYVRIDERTTFEYDTPSGPLIVEGRFREEGTTLIFFVSSVYAKDVLDKGEYRAEAGLASMRKFLEWVAQLASDLGYERLRIVGHRTKRNAARGGRQRFEFDLAQYLRTPRPAR